MEQQIDTPATQNKYKHIFFDLDHTLWDFELNAKETLQDLYELNALNTKGIIDFDSFFSRYSYHNERLWDRYTKGFIKQEELRWKRMWLSLLDFKIADEVKLQLGLNISYLLSAKIDSGKTAAASPYKTTTDYFNRFDFAISGSIEYHSASKWMIGARYNIGLNNATKKLSSADILPPFIPESFAKSLKNNSFQMYIGYKLTARE